MLGRCPRSSLNRTTSKGELCTHTHEITRLPSPEDEKPLLQPPHQIVIGFDLGADSSRSSHLHQAVCDSPRSVLEPHHLCFRSHHQPVRSPRSPLSALGSLLSSKTPNAPCAKGAALCLKAAIKAEEAVGSVESQPTFSRWGLVAGHYDGVDAYPAFSKREHAAADYCKTIKIGDPLTFPRTNRAEGRKNQPCKHGPSNHASRRSRAKCSHAETFLSSDGEEEDNNEAAAAGSGDVGILPESIFSTASPVANYLQSEILGVDFLSRCYLCKRRLLLGKDIYMYRGDRAFCSKECRHKQIVVDERKERRLAGGACVPGASSHHQSFQRANQAAVA